VARRVNSSLGLLGAMMLVTVRPRPPSRQVLDNWNPALLAVRIMFQVTQIVRFLLERGLRFRTTRLCSNLWFRVRAPGPAGRPSPLSPIINLKAEPALVRLHLGPARAGRRELVRKATSADLHWQRPEAQVDGFRSRLLKIRVEFSSSLRGATTARRRKIRFGKYPSAPSEVSDSDPLARV
jgi:hypothetical protein